MKYQIKGHIEKKAAKEYAQKKRKGLHVNTDTEFFAEPINAELNFELPDEPPQIGAEEESE